MPDRTVEVTLEIAAPPRLVIDAFTVEEHLNQWWAVNRSLIQMVPGGAYALVWGAEESGFRYVTTGTVTAYEPARRLHVENMLYFNPGRPILGPMTLSIVAFPTIKGSTVNLTQAGYREGPDWEWYYKAVETGWPEALNNLKIYLEKHTGRE